MKSLEELRAREEQAELGGGNERIAKQHAAGKKTARERIHALLDEGSFQETDKFVTHRCSHFGMQEKGFPGDGVVTGTGMIEGRRVCVFAQDFTVFGGSLAEAHAEKICKIMDLAASTSCPIIGINDSGGARIQEGVESLAGYAEIFWRNVQYSGLIPQISIIAGPCAGGAVYSPALTDFIFMVDNTSHMFITGPDVIRTVTREEVDKESLGGSKTHTSTSGVAHFRDPSDSAALMRCRELLRFLPSSCQAAQQQQATEDTRDRKTDRIQNIIPGSPSKPYDMREIIREIADDAYFFEVQAEHAQNILIGFIHVAGRTVGVVANQPKFLAGCLDIHASMKAARFIRCCDAFRIPICTLVDVPGFLPGVQQELGGIIRHGSKLLYAYAEASVPLVTLIVRKAYGGAYDVMASKHIRADMNFAYPCAEIAVMGPEAAVNVIFREELEKQAGPDKKKNRHDELVKEYRETFANPWKAAERGYVDAVIDPAETRMRMIQAFDFLENKKVAGVGKRHGNMPL